jgi:flagellar hook assembly protein FlgD
MLTERSAYTLSIYNILGQTVRQWEGHAYMAGVQAVDWDGRDDYGRAVSSGIYFYTLRAQAFTGTKKMILLK